MIAQWPDAETASYKPALKTATIQIMLIQTCVPMRVVGPPAGMASSGPASSAATMRTTPPVAVQCVVEDGWDRADNTCQSICGDELVVGDEECDDGNDADDDACIACRDAFCGDGFVQLADEECDDQNDVNEDECTNQCQDAECGDGIVGPVNNATIRMTSMMMSATTHVSASSTRQNLFVKLRLSTTSAAQPSLLDQTP